MYGRFIVLISNWQRYIIHSTLSTFLLPSRSFNFTMKIHANSISQCKQPLHICNFLSVRLTWMDNIAANSSHILNLSTSPHCQSYKHINHIFNIGARRGAWAWVSSRSRRQRQHLAARPARHFRPVIDSWLLPYVCPRERL